MIFGTQNCFFLPTFCPLSLHPHLHCQHCSMKVPTGLCILFSTPGIASAFLVGLPPPSSSSSIAQSTALSGWLTGGSGKDDLDEQWRAQQEILKNRRKPASERKKYFEGVEKRREEASKEQERRWGWQKADYSKGGDPINEWKKRRADGTISDLNDQYGDPKKIGGIPLPGASFGIGGEFGVGGKFDNGGRFDLRLPYAEQGWVDEDDSGFRWPWQTKEKKGGKGDKK